MQADTTPETRPRSATEGSTVRYGSCDADHKSGRAYFAPRYFSSSRDTRRNSRRSARSSRVRTRSAHVREAWGNLARARCPVVPRYSVQVAVIGPALDRPTARGPRWRGPVVILRAGWDAGVQVGSIVMALSPPRYLPGRRCAGGAGPGRGGPAGGTSSAPRRSLRHRSPVPVSHFTSLCARCRRLATKEAGRSPVPVAHGAIPFCRRISGGTASLTDSWCARRHPPLVVGSRHPGSIDPARTFAQLRSVRRAISPGAVTHSGAWCRRRRAGVRVVCDRRSGRRCGVR